MNDTERKGLRMYRKCPNCYEPFNLWGSKGTIFIDKDNVLKMDVVCLNCRKKITVKVSEPTDEPWR